MQDIKNAATFTDKINAIEHAAIDLSLARTGRPLNTLNPTLQEKLRIAARFLASNLEDSLWTSCMQIKNAMKLHTKYNKWDNISVDISSAWHNIIFHIHSMVIR